MAVVNVLPNGYLIVTLSPREALMVSDQVLDPGEFPWQSSESQMVAMEFKSMLKNVLEALQRAKIEQIKQFIPPPEMQQPPNNQEQQPE